MVMRKYTNDYEIVETTDEKGKDRRTAVYRGIFFEVSLAEEALRKYKSASASLVAVLSILQLSAGFIDHRGGYQFYISLPYVFSFFPIFYLAAGVAKIPREKRTYQRDEIGLSFGRMMTASKILFSLVAFGLIGEVVFLLFSSETIKNESDILYLLIQVLVAAGAYFTITIGQKIKINPAAEDHNFL